MFRYSIKGYFAGILLLGSIVGMQIAHDSKYPHPIIPEFHYIPDSRIIRMIIPHMAQMASDMYWIKTVLYFGRTSGELGGGGPPVGREIWQSAKSDSPEHTPREIPSYRLLSDMLNTVVTLDPYFSYPYIFGGLFLSLGGGLVDDAIELLKRGRPLFPEDWRFPFYLGYNYFFFKYDGVAALGEFIQAAAMPGRPVIIHKLIESIVIKEKRAEVAENFLEGAILSAKNPGVRAELEKLLEEMKK